ncbi:cyclophilin-like fold protein [Palleniella muris]|nr:cyclophilin-like fold protein [Palleniella muris]
MRKASILAMAMCIMMSLPACEPDERMETSAIPEKENGHNNKNENNMTTKMKITVGNYTLTASLEDNATAQAFAAKLPITLPMLDLYGREMCYRFPEELPADNARTRGYKVGEIVYYPPMHSFVIMYAQNGEHFLMQSIGHVEGDVSIFNGIGDVNVRFERME